MAVILAAHPRPVVPHGRRSPTLSDAGMILPVFEADSARAASPAPYLAERPPSPPALYADPAHVHLASAPQSRREPSTRRKSPALSAQSSRSTLRNMPGSAAAAHTTTTHDDTLASSPTIQDAMTTLADYDERRLSTASSSVHSEDLDNWPGFDSHDNSEDSGVDLEEKRDNLPDSPNMADGLGHNHWQSPPNSGSDEDDEMTSAALSRRAEMILANAKKRLNVMEGNLRGARASLVVSPTFNPRSSALDLSQHITAARDRDRRLYAGIGPIPPRIHSYRASPLSPTSPNHLRGMSETSVQLPFTPSYMTTRSTANKRASSAIGHTSGPWSPESYGQGRFPIKESRSVEVLRDPRGTWTTADREVVDPSASRSSRSPPALETLPEDEDGAKIHRPTSAASSLRDQMNDLKGRMASLKQKAQEDRLRRRSLQSLRTPSPFTSADSWYSGTNAYKSSESSLSANAGLGIKTGSPTRHALYEDEHSHDQTPRTAAARKEGEKLVSYDTQEQSRSPNGHAYPEQYQFPQTEPVEETETFEDEEETDEGEFVSVNGDGNELAGDSVYEDAVYEMSVTERHEDRVDAFDYEHFFLHSAMGTYSTESRRSSISSDSSTETTRPVTAMQTSEELSSTERRISIHQRNPSVDSVSTIASFATAAEEQYDEDEENEEMDQFSQQILSSQPPVMSRSATRSSAGFGGGSLRTDSAINMRRGNGSSPTQASLSRGSSSPAELASGLQTSKIFSILTEGSRAEARLALSEEETELIYGLAASMQQVCSNLQSTYGEAYERKAWRRRLDEARRILNGEDGEDDQSF
ncbi:hypothetical protein ACN47E_002702 [Coniothyrium glycines]